uniref:Ig-like domain-containing protein n=1 Tax=Myripristis murdjan TaxID=586833 RepID=A0A667WLS6_9TELE
SAHVSAADCHVLWAQKDNVLQPKADVTATEGEAVTLGCEYNTSSTTAYLYWYKQDVKDRPRFILSRSTFSYEKTEDGVKNRFKSRLNSTLRSVPLTIVELQPSDSAVYYCASTKGVLSLHFCLIPKAGTWLTQPGNFGPQKKKNCNVS